MAPDPVTQERIYEAIKHDFLACLLRPGVRLEIQMIADRHRSSTTPVREVLHRLEGERLLEPRPEGGFRIAIPDAAELEALYDWNGRLLLSAVGAAPVGALKEALRSVRGHDPGDGVVDLVSWVGNLFDVIAAATDNVEYIRQIRSANERLNYVRVAEHGVFDDMKEQMLALVRNGYLDVRRGLGRRIRAYHRRRVRSADEILAALTKVNWEAAAKVR